jgi:glycosyltransferase involved in cell wall biosynthesis
MPQVAVLVWKKLSRRSELLAQALDANLWVFPDIIPYMRAAIRTLMKIIRYKPKNLIIQLPQGPLLLEALLLKRLLGYKVLADVHTGFLLSTDWKGKILNAPFVKLLHYSDLVIAHNEAQLNLIPKNAKNKTLVVLDPWPFITTPNTHLKTIEEQYIVFPASFAPDEPLQEVIDAVKSHNINIKLFITGNWKRKPEIKKSESDHIKFTGFLSKEEFGILLAQASAIITGTKREFTSLMSGWEAVAYTKPLAVTKTRTLKNLFGEYAIFYDWRNNQSIANAIKNALDSKPNLPAREKLRIRTMKTIAQLESKCKIKS